MKLIKLLMIFLVCTFAFSNVTGQSNAFIGVLTQNSGLVNQGGTVYIQVTVGNTGPTAPIGVNKVRAQISLPSAICTALPNAQQTGLPAGWTITVNTGGVITVCNGSNTIPVGAARTILIAVQGNNLGGPSTVTGNLIFSSGTSCTTPGTLPGDNTADNSSTSSIQVVPSTQCILAVTATAGNIPCFGGTTTLTASSGQPTNVEYSLNGGAFQASNNFIVPAGTHTVTARQINNPGCTANSNTVTVTQPSTAVSVAASATNTTTVGGSDGTATAVPVGGTAPYTYLWSPGGQTTATATGLTAGTYTVTVTDANGCTAIASATVSDPVVTCNLAVSASAGTISCNGGTTTLTATATGASGAVEYSLNGGAFQSSNTFTVNAAGSPYTVVAREVATPTCTATATAVTVTEPTQLVASSSATAILCNGGTSTVTISATGGTAPYTGTGTFTQAAGTQSYTVTDANGCTSSVSVTVTEPAQLVTSSSATAILCNGGTSTVTVSATGGTAPFTGTGTFTVTAGTYNYTVTDANGCTSVTSVTITEPIQLVATSTALSITCNGGLSTVTVSATGGIAPYTGTGNFNVTAGTYNYTVTDANGCTAVTTITITEPSAIIVTAIATPILCNGGSSTVTVSATGGTAPYIGTGTFNVVAGTYTYTVTDANECSASITITVSEPAVLVASSSATAILCNGGSSTVTVSATGGTAPYTGTGTFNVTAGTYNYTVTDANGCTVVTSVTITEPTQLVASSTATVLNCNGELSIVIVSATGGTAPYTGTGTFNRTAGTYSFTVTDANGCTAVTTITIAQPAVLAVITSSTPASGGSNGTATANPTGGTAPYTYLWTPGGQTTQTATGLAAGNYTVVVTDSKGCTATATVTVTSSGCTLVVNAGPDKTLCGSSNVTLAATVSGVSAGLPPATPFTELSGSTADMRLFSGKIDHITIGNTFSMGEDRNNCGKLTSSSKILTIPAGAVVKKAYLYWSGSGVQDTKVKFNGTLVTADNIKTATRSGGFSYFGARKDVTSMVTASGNYTVTELEWNNGSPYCFDNSAYGAWAMTVIYEQASLPSARIHVNTEKFVFTYPANTYSTTINNVSVPAGCSADAKLTIVAFEGDNYKGERLRIAGVLDADPNNFRGQAGPNLDIITKNAPSIVGGTTSLTYSIESYTANTIFGLATEGLFDYVKVLKYNNCPAPGPCNVTYQWKRGATVVGTTQSISVNTPGTYEVSATDCRGCVATDQVVVTASTLAATSTVGAPINCFGGTTTVSLAATGGTAPYTGTGTFIRGAGTWNFTVTDAAGCSVVRTVTIAQPAQLVASATAPAIVCGQTTTTVTVAATGGTAPYTGTGAFVRGAGTYTFNVTDSKGCTSSCTITIAAPQCGPVNPNKCYKLVVRATNKSATVINGSTSNGTQLEESMYTGAAYQIYKFVSDGTGYYTIIPQHATNKVLGVQQCSNSDNKAIQLQVPVGTNCQKWQLIPLGSYFIIKNKQSGRVWDAEGNITQRTQTNANDQQWTIAEVSCSTSFAGNDDIYVSVKQEFDVEAYPNPSNSHFNLTINSSDKTTPINVRLLDVNGRVMTLFPNVQVLKGNSMLRIEGGQLPGGVYFAEVTQGNKRKTIRLVKAG